LVEYPPGGAAVDGVLAHNGRVRQQPQQAHLSHPAEEKIVRLPVHPVGGDRVMRVPSLVAGQVHGRALAVNSSISLAASARSEVA
jgi:hypothetical protein